MIGSTTRWTVSPHDYRAHAVTDNGTGDTVMTARCGHVMPREAGLDDGPRAQLCGACLLMVKPPPFRSSGP